MLTTVPGLKPAWATAADVAAKANAAARMSFLMGRFTIVVVL